MATRTACWAFGIIGLVAALPAQEILPAPVGTLQIRLVEDPGAGVLRAEMDVAPEANLAVLSISSKLKLAGVGGVVPAVLLPDVVLPMTFENALTVAVDLPLPTPALAAFFVQGIMLGPHGNVQCSGATPYRASSTRPGGTGTWTLPAFRMQLLGIERRPPFPHSYAVEASVVLPANAWRLHHLATVRTPLGDDVYLLLQRLPPSQPGQPTPVRHLITADLGILPPNDPRLLVTIGDQPWLQTSEPQFCVVPLGGLSASLAAGERPTAR